jgi:hypothetical protein
MADDVFGHCPELPEGVQGIFTGLCQDVASLYSKWQLYQDLFTSQDDVAVLSEVALATFQIVEEALGTDMTMAICRLSDSHRSCGNDNLSIVTLARQVGQIKGLDALVQQLRNECEPVRQYRDKRIAHNDLNVALKPKENPLPGIGRSRIESILQLAAQILNSVYRSVIDAELGFRSPQIGGGRDLVYWLKGAKEHHHEQLRRLTGQEA